MGTRVRGTGVVVLRMDEGRKEERERFARLRERERERVTRES